MQSNHPDNPDQGEAINSGFSGSGLLDHLDQSSVELDQDTLRQAIPELPSVEGWKDIEIEECGEKLEPFGPFSKNNDIFTSSVYYGEHDLSPYAESETRLNGALIVMFARKEVVASVRHAQQLLPDGHHLIVLDSYRTLKVQQALYDHYSNGLKTKHPDWDDDALSAETQKYVSLPSAVATRPSPHNTGGAVDLAIFRLPDEIEARVKAIDDRLDQLSGQLPDNPTPEQEATDPAMRESYLIEMRKIGLIREHAEFLNFGTQFDHGGSEAEANYFEKLDQTRPLTPDETEARDNRRILHNVMAQAKMQAYAPEWWHFNSIKSQMGAKTAGLHEAEYGGIELSEDNLEQEEMREQHRQGLIKIKEGKLGSHHFAGKLDLLAPKDDTLAKLILLNVEALNETGDPRITHLPKAAVIAPSAE